MASVLIKLGEQVDAAATRMLRSHSLFVMMKVKVTAIIILSASVRWIWGGNWLPSGLDAVLLGSGVVWVICIYIREQRRLGSDWLHDELLYKPWLAAMFGVVSDYDFDFIHEFQQLERRLV